MKAISRKTTGLSLLIAALGLIGWLLLPLDAIRAVASLSDPGKLATLGERGANARLNKIVYWLDQAQRKGMSPETTIMIAQFLNGTREPRASLVKASLSRNLKIADGLGLLTDKNREALRRGKAAMVARGPYAGEPVEVDHIVPYSLAPEVGNELANLEMLPRTLNRSKSNRVGERQWAYAQKLFAAGLLSEQSLAKVKAAR